MLPNSAINGIKTNSTKQTLSQMLLKKNQFSKIISKIFWNFQKNKRVSRALMKLWNLPIGIIYIKTQNNLVEVFHHKKLDTFWNNSKLRLKRKRALIQRENKHDDIENWKNVMRILSERTKIHEVRRNLQTNFGVWFSNKSCCYSHERQRPTEESKQMRWVGDIWFMRWKISMFLDCEIRMQHVSWRLAFCLWRSSFTKSAGFEIS